MDADLLSAIRGPTGAIIEPDFRDRLEVIPSLMAASRELIRPLRVPHYTCSRDAILAEMALAAGGYMLLLEGEAFRRTTIDAVMSSWREMRWTRPTIVITQDYLHKGAHDIATLCGDKRRCYFNGDLGGWYA